MPGRGLPRWLLAGAPWIAILLLATRWTPALSQLQAHDDAAATGPTAEALIRRAMEVLGSERVEGKVVHSRAVWAEQQNYQSDRYYPPFFDRMSTVEAWFEPASGVQRVTAHAIFPGIDLSEATSLYDGRGGVSLRTDAAVPIARSQLRTRNLDPRAVLYDWSRADNVRVAQRVVYRDYPRWVLERPTRDGVQKLFVDPKTGFPVKLDYMEPHYLWGQRHIEYIYSNWIRAADIQASASSFRVADGAVEISATTSSTEAVGVGASPSMQMPTTDEVGSDLPVFLQPKAPEALTAGPTTYLLTNPGYTEAVTLAANQIYVFDATQSEDRARLDAEAIARLFPGKHRINVVVTDLAWPHVAGVRFWVAQGATVISHRAARPFLETIVNRRWTVRPDLLERQRKSARFQFVGIDAITKTADGLVTLIPIDGIGSEVALIAYVANDGFLWASDYIQTTNALTDYTSDVLSAVNRARLQPRQVAAQHVGLTPWTVVEQLSHTSGAPRPP